MPKPIFVSIRTALVPVIAGHYASVALQAARALAPRVLLVGLVPVPPDASLSSATQSTRALRRRLRKFDNGKQVRARSPVCVSNTPWEDLQEIFAHEQPDLLELDINIHLSERGITPVESLAHSICDTVLVRGPFPKKPRSVLMPGRGSPYAKLAIRIGLRLHPEQLTALHIKFKSGSEAPFRGFERVLESLPGVQLRQVTTKNVARTILHESQKTDVIVLGATARATYGRNSFGPVADTIFKESSAAVMRVKTRQSMTGATFGEAAGARAISILVDKWFVDNTFHANEFSDLNRLLALKQKQGLTISLAMPALNEANTIGKVVRSVKRALMEKVPLLDEIILIDSDSTDETREIAEKPGVPVYIHQNVLPQYGARRGKGEALWKSLLVARGDVIAWIDTDIDNIHPRFVYGILGPLLVDPRIQFVKGFYQRPLQSGDKVQAGGGGRVTELTARPLLNLFYPELSGVIQPLSGEYAGRRSALERATFFSGYGVETGLLMDIFEQHGLPAIAQVDLLERVHHNQELQALSKMAFAILQTVLCKLERRYERVLLDEVNKTLKLGRYANGGYCLDIEELAERERPPMQEVPGYRARQSRRKQ